MTEKIFIGDHVIAALQEKMPLVALETALVTHGLPKPLNVETALAMEAAVRAEGAVPCTIGVLGGRIVLGLAPDELDRLAAENEPVKIGLRELPYAAASEKSGGTTVSATSYLAHRYGIRIFATGGIGGVHRGAGTTFDISNDLTVLGRTPLTVVSSGAKAILDLKLTLEYLETAGVTVAGYKTKTFPAFYSQSSPYKLPLQLTSASQAAQVALVRDGLGLPSALLVCNPVPQDVEIPWSELMSLVAQADDEIRKGGISGQDVTPEMLRRMFVLSEERTLKANLALLVENARLGAQIACNMQILRSENDG
ncbi:MAG: pseudouridine-5'-phosphate glycosidase [Bacillota bacterium]|nr:pseudouridine-5'-phosphate glycosidase [Bacillota bacterium]MDW7683926.1 pseudouridine-5'-phosphate glycosidase [Bacillota bacterium]